MNTLPSSSVRLRIISSLTVEGINEALATGIADILVSAGHVPPDLALSPLILTKTQLRMVTPLKGPVKIFSPVMLILPRLFLNTDLLFAAPGRFRRYWIFQSCRRAVIIERAEA